MTGGHAPQVACGAGPRVAGGRTPQVACGAGPASAGRRAAAALSCLAALTAACTTAMPPAATLPPKEQVLAAERAFAATMARRDLAAFAAFVDDEAIFFTGAEPLRGKAAVVRGWARFFDDGPAPFSWEPDEVEVLASGTLAHSSGPVRGPDGEPVARFNSVWRLRSPGVWTVVFDKGSPLPNPPGRP